MKCKHGLSLRTLDEGETCTLLVCNDGCSLVVLRESLKYGRLRSASNPK